MINKRALEKAINDTMREQFAANMREYLVCGAPKEVNELYKRYVDECLAEEERHKRHVKFLRKYLAVSCACSIWLYLILLAAGVL